MSDEEAEKAWEARERFFAEAGYPEQTDYHRGISYIGFKAGWRARDAEVAALRGQVAELEAVIQKVLKLRQVDWGMGNAGLDARTVHEILESAPSAVLEERDREVAARAWDEGKARFRDPEDKRGCVCFDPDHRRLNPALHWLNPYRGDNR